MPTMGRLYQNYPKYNLWYIDIHTLSHEYGLSKFSRIQSNRS